MGDPRRQEVTDRRLAGRAVKVSALTDRLALLLRQSYRHKTDDANYFFLEVDLAASTKYKHLNVGFIENL